MESGDKLGLGLSSFRWELGPILAESPHIIFLTHDLWREGSHYRKGQVVSPRTVPLTPFASIVKKIKPKQHQIPGAIEKIRATTKDSNDELMMIPTTCPYITYLFGLWIKAYKFWRMLLNYC